MSYYFSDNAESDSPFVRAYQHIAATGDRPEQAYSITELDEFLMITYNILDSPVYADDPQVKAFQHELELAITRATCNL